jgi:hypothetical protein
MQDCSKCSKGHCILFHYNPLCKGIVRAVLGLDTSPLQWLNRSFYARLH